MIWIQAISVPLLGSGRTEPAQTAKSQRDLKELHYQPSEEQHSGSHSSGQLLSWLPLPIQLLSRVLEYSPRVLFHRPVASTFYAQLALFIGVEEDLVYV